MECSCLNGPRNEATENGRLWSVGLVARGVMGGGGKKGEGIRGDSWRGKTDRRSARRWFGSNQESHININMGMTKENVTPQTKYTTYTEITGKKKLTITHMILYCNIFIYCMVTR